MFPTTELGLERFTILYFLFSHSVSRFFSGEPFLLQDVYVSPHADMVVADILPVILR